MYGCFMHVILYVWFVVLCNVRMYGMYVWCVCMWCVYVCYVCMLRMLCTYVYDMCVYTCKSVCVVCMCVCYACTLCNVMLCYVKYVIYVWMYIGIIAYAALCYVGCMYAVCMLCIYSVYATYVMYVCMHFHMYARMLCNLYRLCNVWNC